MTKLSRSQRAFCTTALRRIAAITLLAILLPIWLASAATPLPATPAKAITSHADLVVPREQLRGSDSDAAGVDDALLTEKVPKNTHTPIKESQTEAGNGGAQKVGMAADDLKGGVDDQAGDDGGDAADSLSDFQKAIGGSKGGDEKKEPELEFVRDNPQWLTDSEDMAADFVNTPAMEHLKHDRLGELDASEVDFNMFEQLRRSTHSTLARCSHVGRLALDSDRLLPKIRKLPPCSHRKMTLLFLMDPVVEVEDPLAPKGIFAALSSVNARLFAFAGQLEARGHTVLIAGAAELVQVDFSLLDAIIVVKTLGHAFEKVKNSTVPLIWDHVDYWGELPFYQLDLWEHKAAFAGVFTASRITQAAFMTASIPAHILYHNHANYPGFHRPDREPAVKVVSLPGDFRTSDLDVIPAMQAYCKAHSLEFRYGKYTGHGRDVAELSAVVTPRAQDWGDQLKYVMGMASVDIAVLWPKNYGQFDVCYKPTSRLSQFASLGIPVVSYPFGSYIDLFVEFGYPFVAQTLEEMTAMLEMLRNSAVLRQEASRILLSIAKHLSVEELAEEYERGLCSFIGGDAPKKTIPHRTDHVGVSTHS